MRKIAFFDFDGTITTTDTLWSFLIWHKGFFPLSIAILRSLPWLLGYMMRVVPNHRAKQRLLQHAIGGASTEEFNEACRSFAVEKIPSLLRRGALSEIERLKSQGFDVVVVSASPENWIQTWTEQHSLKLLATRLEVIDQKITGRFLGANCYGAEKVSRIRQRFSLDSYEQIFAYGDTEGDRPMLNLAHTAYFKPFRN